MTYLIDPPAYTAAYTLRRRHPMVGGRPPARSRQSMLATLVRHLQMVRITAVVALSAAALTGCVGEIEGNDGGDGGLTPEQLEARVAFTEKAKPHLVTNCQSCHAGARGEAVAFLLGATDVELRDSLINFASPIVNLSAPSSSRLLTKGIHEGPQFTGPQLSDVLEWIAKEKVAAGAGTVDQELRTDAMRPLLCSGGNPGDPTCPINSIPLDSVGVPGGSISFVADPTDSALYLRRLQLNPGPTGAYIEHPLLVSYPEAGDPVFDTLDRFFSVKMNLAVGAMPELIAGGNAIFVGLKSTDELRFHFKLASAFQPETTGPDPLDPGATGCKSLDTFKANARGPLQTSCASCHANAGNPAASALSLVGIDSADDAVVKNACDQTRLRANLQDLNNSGLYLAPAPGNANHPFQFPNAGALDAFRTPVNLWLTAERDAP